MLLAYEIIISVVAGAASYLLGKSLVKEGKKSIDHINKAKMLPDEHQPPSSPKPVKRKLHATQ